LLAARAQANGLDRPVCEAGPGGVADVVRRTAGVQGQSWRGLAYAVRARSTATTWSDVSAAQERDRSVLRGWFMRGTLQLVATEDAGRLLGLLGPKFIKDTERRYGELGLPATVRSRAAELIEAHLLENGPTSRAAIGDLLARAGLIPEPTGQTVYALIRHAGLLGLICYGPGHDANETWVTVRDWLGRPLTLNAEGAAEELARRYLTAYGPSTAKDFATWSGLPVPTARTALKAVAKAEVVVEGESFAAIGDLSGCDDLRLLGEFDPYLLGYQDRRYALADEHRKDIHPGGGMLRPAVVRAGRVIGSWKHAGPEIDLFEPPEVDPADGDSSDPADGDSSELAAEVADELEDLARFRG
jgi:hypothetical protein